MTDRILEIKLLGDVFTNQFGYPSSKIRFYDPVSRLGKTIFIHERHEGHYGIWKRHEKTGVNTKLKGEIKKIELNETMIRSVRTYANAKIIKFQSIGRFVIIEFSDLNNLRNLQIALRDQLYSYVTAKNQLFNPY